jgi:acylphosphatase
MTRAVARRRVVVRGRVQGVFFRDTVRRRAAAEGVAGWVRNRPDGAVEAVFEGAPDAVARLVEVCSRGPARAEVTGIECSDEHPEGITGFSVR